MTGLLKKVGEAFRGRRTAPVQVTPVSVHDVAAYILQKHGPMTTMKLQKLVYYAQAWGLVWDDCPLFNVFHTPPGPAPTKNVYGSCCDTENETTRPPGRVGPISR